MRVSKGHIARETKRAKPRTRKLSAKLGGRIVDVQVFQVSEYDPAKRIGRDGKKW
jgi:hypothetical protein